MFVSMKVYNILYNIMLSRLVSMYTYILKYTVQFLSRWYFQSFLALYTHIHSFSSNGLTLNGIHSVRNNHNHHCRRLTLYKCSYLSDVRCVYRTYALDYNNIISICILEENELLNNPQNNNNETFDRVCFVLKFNTHITRYHIAVILLCNIIFNNIVPIYNLMNTICYHSINVAAAVAAEYTDGRIIITRNPSGRRQQRIQVTLFTAIIVHDV